VCPTNIHTSHPISHTVTVLCAPQCTSTQHPALCRHCRYSSYPVQPAPTVTTRLSRQRKISFYCFYVIQCTSTPPTYPLEHKHIWAPGRVRASTTLRLLMRTVRSTRSRSALRDSVRGYKVRGLEPLFRCPGEKHLALWSVAVVRLCDKWVHLYYVGEKSDGRAKGCGDTAEG
jgi:hypothetical protein